MLYLFKSHLNILYIHNVRILSKPFVWKTRKLMRLKFKFSIYRKNLSWYKKVYCLNQCSIYFSLRQPKTHQRLCYYITVLRHGHGMISVWEEVRKKSPFFPVRWIMQNICFMRAMELRVENTHRHFKFLPHSTPP